MSEGTITEPNIVQQKIQSSIEGQKPSWKNWLSRRLSGNKASPTEAQNSIHLPIEINQNRTKELQQGKIHLVTSDEVVGQLQATPDQILGIIKTAQERPLINIPPEYRNTVTTRDGTDKPVKLQRTGIQIITTVNEASDPTKYETPNPTNEEIRREIIGISQPSDGVYCVWFLDGNRSYTQVPNLKDARLSEQQKNDLTSFHQRQVDPLTTNMYAVQLVDKNKGFLLTSASNEGKLMFLTTRPDMQNAGYHDTYIGIQNRKPDVKQRIPDLKNIRSQIVKEADLVKMFSQVVVPQQT